MMYAVVLAFACCAALAAAQPGSCVSKVAMDAMEESLVERAVSRDEGTTNVLNPINDKRQAAGGYTIFWCPVITNWVQNLVDQCNIQENSGIGYKGFATIFGSGSISSLASQLMSCQGSYSGGCPATFTDSNFRMVGCGYGQCNGQDILSCHFA